VLAQEEAHEIHSASIDASLSTSIVAWGPMPPRTPLVFTARSGEIRMNT
jgi:hypothetical protein